MLNEKEYEELKRMYEIDYKWVAKDEDGSMWVYEVRPHKANINGNKIWDATSGKIDVVYEPYDFIKWEDEEPYNIEKLLDEYNRPQDETVKLTITKIESKHDYYTGEQVHYIKGEINQALPVSTISSELELVIPKEKKYYAKIKGAELFTNLQFEHWNYVEDSENFVISDNNESSGYKTKFTLEEWNELGINGDNATFEEVEK